MLSPLIVHIRSAGASSPALCGVPLPAAQSACYQPAEASVCQRCIRTRSWERHLAVAALAYTYSITPAGIAALAQLDQEVA